MGSEIKIEPLICYIPIIHGVARYDDLEIEQDFGGTLETKVLGHIICVIAHECGGEQAVRLFIRCLAPRLFPGGEPMAGLREALHIQLNYYFEMILNKGVGHNFTKRFIEALEDINVPQLYSLPNCRVSDRIAN